MKNARKMWFIRVMLLLSLPFMLAWAFVRQLFDGLRDAFYYAWLEVRIEYDSFNAIWDQYDGTDQVSTKLKQDLK